jgi:hypothetical protein
MIKWDKMYTHMSYPFFVYRNRQGYGDTIVLSEAPDIDYKTTKSLTNNIEAVLEHFLCGLNFGGESVNSIKFYQWCEGEGLFHLDFGYEPCPHRGMAVYKVEWKFISKNLKTFEVLYCD